MAGKIVLHQPRPSVVVIKAVDENHTAHVNLDQLPTTDRREARRRGELIASILGLDFEDWTNDDGDLS